jgi:cytochrome oxidase Cu insertion factor (SCO1/SenC/PrrC family)
VTALALVLAPVATAVVLLVSGWSKLGDVTGLRLAFVAMRVPTALSRVAVVRSLPYVELALGLALLLTWGWLLAVVGATVTVLFLGYTLLVARVLRAGDSVDCQCFGSLGDDRVTLVTLARNLVLVALAALATAFGVGGSGVVPAMGDFDGAAWWWPVMTALVVLAAVLVVRPGRVEEVAPEEGVDYLRQPIPIGVLVAADGRHVQLRDLASQRPQLLTFMSVSCGACDVLADLFPDFVERLGVVEIVTIFVDPLDSVPERLRKPGTTTYHDPDRAVTDLFTSLRPAAVLFGADGLLAGGPVTGVPDIQAFVEDIVAELEAAPPGELEADDHGHDHAHDHGHAHDDHDHGHGHAHGDDHGDVQAVVLDGAQEDETDQVDAGRGKP